MLPLYKNVWWQYWKIAALRNVWAASIAAKYFKIDLIFRSLSQSHTHTYFVVPKSKRIDAHPIVREGRTKGYSDIVCMCFTILVTYFCTKIIKGSRLWPTTKRTQFKKTNMRWRKSVSRVIECWSIIILSFSSANSCALFADYPRISIERYFSSSPVAQYVKEDITKEMKKTFYRFKYKQNVCYKS